MWTECFIDNVGLAVVDENVWASSDEFAIEPASIERGFASAIADGFDFFDFVRNLKQARAALKSSAAHAEVETETVSNDRDV